MRKVLLFLALILLLPGISSGQPWSNTNTVENLQTLNTVTFSYGFSVVGDGPPLHQDMTACIPGTEVYMGGSNSVVSLYDCPAVDSDRSSCTRILDMTIHDQQPQPVIFTRGYAMVRTVDAGAGGGTVFLVCPNIPNMRWDDTSDEWGVEYGSGGHVIQDDGSNLPDQRTLNVAGTGVECLDDPGSSRTTCTIPGVAGGSLPTGGEVGETIVNSAPNTGDWNEYQKFVASGGRFAGRVCVGDVEEGDALACMAWDVTAACAFQDLDDDGTKDAGELCIADIDQADLTAHDAASDAHPAIAIDLDSSQSVEDSSAASKCARFDAGGILVAATGDCGDGTPGNADPAASAEVLDNDGTEGAEDPYVRQANGNIYFDPDHDGTPTARMINEALKLDGRICVGDRVTGPACVAWDVTAACAFQDLDDDGTKDAGELCIADIELADLTAHVVEAGVNAAHSALHIDLASSPEIKNTTVASKCARFDASGVLIAATGDCAAGDTGGEGNAPGGAGSELQYRQDETTFGAVANSSVSGENVTLGPDSEFTAGSLEATCDPGSALECVLELKNQGASDTVTNAGTGRLKLFTKGDGILYSKGDSTQLERDLTTQYDECNIMWEFGAVDDNIMCGKANSEYVIYEFKCLATGDTSPNNQRFEVVKYSTTGTDRAWTNLYANLSARNVNYGTGTCNANCTVAEDEWFGIEIVSQVLSGQFIHCQVSYTK